ncbi:TRAP-type mannitol/chloroaromatic compound transport system, small permease component [Desulfotomaculum arcticum]|uniref:TRAP-type mannitol/chloroaromatic compound transport system, small permease component n=1 Tax=Desulfotruncus arcticus DSM 17038 TaxID=1121424 RepID=A0A1I2P6P9_9FIRM|nr:TRAP transporter small permease [Desulfotruncus arcticus]SFG11842.1 TRAP-type mannitol/chloroaromatic compound transport system, small permease component [Desulfotomaculum arcticum] [Desulfotruncus arcticus DSM 17038]
MEKFTRLCDRLAQGCGYAAGFLMLLGLALILIEIVIRTLFSSTLYITEEYTAYLMVGITFLALSYTLKEKGHIRMVFLHTILKGKARIAVDIYAFTVGLVLCAVITATTALFFWDSVVSQSRSMQISATYLAIPQFFMPLGSFILTLQFAAELGRTIMLLRSDQLEEQKIESGALGR